MGGILPTHCFRFVFRTAMSWIPEYKTYYQSVINQLVTKQNRRQDAIKKEPRRQNVTKNWQ